MFDAPLDGMVLWAGLSLISVAVLGVALSLPAAAPPDAGAVAASIDRVGTSPHQATTTVRVRADAIRLRPSDVSLREGDATAHASFVSATAIPTGDGELRAVLDGAPPETVFEGERDFRTALERARDGPSEWRPAPDRLRVRRVSWGNTSVTLVG